MKKYLITETGEELTFGDVMAICLEKKTEDGTTVVTKECKFTEDTLPFLLNMGIIEEVDEEEDGLVDVEDECPCGYGECIDELYESQEELENRLDDLEESIKQIDKVALECQVMTKKLLTIVEQSLEEEKREKDMNKPVKTPKKK